MPWWGIRWQNGLINGRRAWRLHFRQPPVALNLLPAPSMNCIGWNFKPYSHRVARTKQLWPLLANYWPILASGQIWSGLVWIYGTGHKYKTWWSILIFPLTPRKIEFLRHHHFWTNPNTQYTQYITWWVSWSLYIPAEPSKHLVSHGIAGHSANVESVEFWFVETTSWSGKYSVLACTYCSMLILLHWH